MPGDENQDDVPVWFDNPHEGHPIGMCSCLTPNYYTRVGGCGEDQETVLLKVRPENGRDRGRLCLATRERLR